MAMVVNTSWLLEYLEPACAVEDVLKALPEVGLEIEKQHRLNKALERVTIGFVREMVPHPNKHGSYVCRIETQRNHMVQVICATEHEIREGWGVPVIVADAILPNGTSIKKKKIEGVESDGMICLDGELGLLSNDTGMHYYTDEAVLGVPLTKLIEIPDSEYLLQLNVASNRPDLLGLIGIAREVAALLRLKVRFPEFTLPAPTGKPLVTVALHEPDLCPRYMCVAMKDVKVERSPGWLSTRLRIAGMRPINNVVDVTNYVLYEFGQPLHAFDLRTLRGSRIEVRCMKPAESLKLLNDTMAEINLEAENKFSRPPLVIADSERPVALAGIMGGAATQTTEQSVEILIEAACFDPVNIRRTVKEVNWGKENRGNPSSYRFERGTDPNLMLEGALDRAMQLVHQVAGGKSNGAVLDIYPVRRKPRKFQVRPERVSAVLGTAVDEVTIRDCLTRLRMEVTSDLAVHVPTWRADVDDEVVLIEDVARISGYGQIPITAGRTESTVGLRCSFDRLRNVVADYLVSVGFYEARNLTLESIKMSSWLGNGTPIISLVNPRTQEMSVLRRTLLSSLVRTVDTNIRHGAERVRFFEIDRAFDPDGTAPAPDATESDCWRVAGIAGGPAQRSDWRSGKNADFFDLKGTIEDLLDEVNSRDHSFRPASAVPFISGTCAGVFAGDIRLGYVGQIDPNLVAIERLTFPLFAFELNLQLLEEQFSVLGGYESFSHQPAITRDLAVVVPTTISFADLETVVRDSAGKELESLRLLDLYHGPQVPKGHHSLAIHLIFRDPKESLTAELVSANITRVVDTLGSRFGAQLRS